MQRISVVGTSGSGKTTLARDISQLLGIPHVELDYLHWEPNWVEVSDDNNWMHWNFNHKFCTLSECGITPNFTTVFFHYNLIAN